MIKVCKPIPKSLKSVSIFRIFQAARPLDPFVCFRARQSLWCSLQAGLGIVIRRPPGRGAGSVPLGGMLDGAQYYRAPTHPREPKDGRAVALNSSPLCVPVPSQGVHRVPPRFCHEASGSSDDTKARRSRPDSPAFSSCAMTAAMSTDWAASSFPKVSHRRVKASSKRDAQGRRPQ